MLKHSALALAPAALTMALLVAGCSSSKVATTPVIPVTPKPSVVNSYVGTQNVSNVGATSLGGVWGLTLNDALHEFSAEDYSNIPSLNFGTPITGTTQAAGAFVTVVPGNAGGALTNGLALSVAGEAAMIRPGYNGEAPVVLAGQTSCLGVKPATQFLFVSLPNVNWLAPYNPAYGTVKALSAGSSWTFGGAQQYLLSGAGAATLNIPQGTCQQAQEGYVISVPPTGATGGATWTFGIGPSGYFVGDLGSGNPSAPGPSGLVGVIEPSAPVATAELTGSKFLGFYYEPLAGNLGLPVTQPVAFGQGAHTATSIVGGVFATDDPSTTPNADTLIDLGTEDGSTNGLYRNATVVVPDPNGVCLGAAVTTTPSGDVGCILKASAVVGHANGRFSVFLISWDTTNATPLGIYLYGQ